MVTGDNMLTAVSVARQSGFIGQGQKVILVTAAEVDGEMQIQYHSDGATLIPAAKINEVGAAWSLLYTSIHVGTM